MNWKLQKRNTVNGSFSIRTHSYFGKKFSKKFLLWKKNWIIPKEHPLEAFRGLLWWLSRKESTCNAGAAGDLGSVPGSGRSAGEAHGHPLQYSCLENLMDRGAWRAMVHGAAESDMTEATEQAHTPWPLEAKIMTTKDAANRVKPQQG